MEAEIKDSAIEAGTSTVRSALSSNAPLPPIENPVPQTAAYSRLLALADRRRVRVRETSLPDLVPDDLFGVVQKFDIGTVVLLRRDLSERVKTLVLSYAIAGAETSGEMYGLYAPGRGPSEDLTEAETRANRAGQRLWRMTRPLVGVPAVCPR